MFYPYVIELCEHITSLFFILKRKLHMKPLHKKPKEFSAAAPSHQQRMTDKAHLKFKSWIHPPVQVGW